MCHWEKDFAFDRNSVWNKFFFDLILGNCELDIVCYRSLMRADRQNDVPFINKYLSNGSLIIIPLRTDQPSTTGVAKQIISVMTKRNFSTSDLVLVHINDEHKPVPELVKFYSTWRKVYRQFWWNVSLFRGLKENGQLDWLPLGYVHIPEKSVKLKQASQRKHIMSFIGSNSTNVFRPELLRQISMASNTSIFTSVQNEFASGSTQSYVQTLSDSIFCIMIPGHSAECHRFYESLESGCIPVIIDEFEETDRIQEIRDFYLKHPTIKGGKPRRRVNYTDDNFHQYSLLLDTTDYINGPPFPWVRNVVDFVNVLHSVSSAPSSSHVDRMQQITLDWWRFSKKRFEEYYSTNLCNIMNA
jgi:hypothetical protein